MLTQSPGITLQMRTKITDLREDLESARRIVKRLELTLYYETIALWIVFMPGRVGKPEKPEIIGVSTDIEVSPKSRPYLHFKVVEGEIGCRYCDQKPYSSHLPKDEGSFKTFATEIEAQTAIKRYGQESLNEIVTEVNAILTNADRDNPE